MALGALALASPVRAGGDHGGGGHSHGHDAGHGQGAPAHGHDEPDPAQAFARHGGVVLAGNGLLFEVVFSDSGVRVHPMDAAGKALAAAGLSGSVLLKDPRGRRLTLTLSEVPGTHDSPGHLEAKRDLRAVRDGSRTAILTVEGLGPDHGERASLWTRFERAASRGESPGHGHGHDSGHGHAH